MPFLEKSRKNSNICDENLLNFSGRSGAKEYKFVIFGNVGNLVNIGPFTLMVARVLSLRRAALAGRPVSHLVDRLVHQCFCSRVTAREDDRASSLKKRVRYL